MDMNERHADLILNRSAVVATADGAIYWKENVGKKTTFDRLFALCIAYQDKIEVAQEVREFFTFDDEGDYISITSMNRLLIALNLIRECRAELTDAKHGVDIFSITIILLKMLLRAGMEPTASFMPLVKFYMRNYQFEGQNGETENLLTMPLYRGVEALN